MERIRDFIEVVSVNPVVQLSQVRDVPRQLDFPNELASLIDSYLIVEGANAAAVHGLLSALPKGGAFLLSGVYGTGKSHLLAVLGLLAEFPSARSRFVQRNPSWSPLLLPTANKRFFVAYISLDEFDPTAFALETIVAKEIATEANRKGFPVPTDTSARGEWLHGVWQEVQTNGFDGIVVLIDELAMFLNSKSGGALNRDASFLQFLAQAIKRVPLLLVGTLQRGVEDLQRVEPYALTQIRDRFQQTWVLGLTHALPLINRVLLRKKNEAELHRRLVELHNREGWAKNFSVDQLHNCYPFHPLTVRCLERSIGAFFSRTRSIVTFVQWSVREHLDSSWEQLIAPDALVDHFESDMNSHPQLRPFAQQVLPYFNAGDWGVGVGKVMKVVKSLLAFQIGGEEPSAQTVADALMMDSSDVWALLERLRVEANFVDAVRRTGAPSDTYRLDPQITVTDALRRRLNEAMQSLADDDPRLLRFAWECRSEEWAMPPLFEPRTLTVHWMRTQRRVSVTATNLLRLTEEHLRHVIATLSSPHTEECLHLFFAVPLAVEEQRQHFERLMNALRASEQNRFAFAVAALLPRQLNEAELRRWKENAAVWLLVQDLSLAESELGMKVLERLREMLPARQWETQRLMQRLYSEGVLVGAGSVDVGFAVNKFLGSEFAGFDELVRLATEQILPHIFTKFPNLAPRREASAQTYHALTRLILKGLTAASLDINAQKWLELVAVPLGIVTFEGQTGAQPPFMKLTTPLPDLADKVMQIVGNGKPYRQVEAELAKSEFGLTHELTQLVVAAMLRLGWIVALDHSGNVILTENISTPLTRTVATLQPTRVLSDDEWERVRTLLSALFENVPKTLSPENQQRLWIQLRDEANAWKLTAKDISARLAQWRRELNQNELQWNRTIENIHLCIELASLALQPMPAADGLRQWGDGVSALGLNPEKLKRWRDDLNSASEFFATSSQFLSAARFLTSLGWLPGELAERRSRLLSELQSGEKLLVNWKHWIDEFHQFQNSYANTYIAHHETVHNSEEFKQLQQLKQSEQVRLLTFLSSLPEAPECGREAIRQMESALTQQCSETPLSIHIHLSRSPFCPKCGLTLDKTLSVDVDAIYSGIANALVSLKGWFCDEVQKAKVRCFLSAVPMPDKAMLESVLSLTPESSDEKWIFLLTVSDLLQKALSPFAIVEVELGEICSLLEGRYLTCHEATELFRKWLSEKTPSPETKVRFVWQDSERKQVDDRERERRG